MKKILVINTKYREFGGEDANILEEIKFLKKYYIVEYLEYDNSKKVNFFDFLTFFTTKNLKSNKELKSVISSFKPDIAYVHNTWFKAGLGIFNTLLNSNIKVFLKIHNFRYICAASFLARHHKGKNEFCFRCGFRGKFINKYYRDSLLKSLYLIIYNKKYLNIIRKSNITIFVLNEFHKKTIKELNVPDNKVKIFYNPISFIENNNLNYNKQSDYLVYAGRLSNEKGLSELLNVWSECSFDNLELRIIGDGDLYKMLKDRYESQNIIFYGGLSNEETLNHIKGAKCVITATKMYEGQPRLLNEASAYGVPSIFPEFGGISEYYPSNYPLSFEQYNYDDLKKKLLDLNNEKLLMSASKDVLSFTKNLLSSKNLSEKFDELTR